MTVDSGKPAKLSLLDLLAAMDTVDHNILVQQLQTSSGLSSAAMIKHFTCYLRLRRT